MLSVAASPVLTFWKEMLLPGLLWSERRDELFQFDGTHVHGAPLCAELL